jgi:hypothetical protein
MIATSLPPPQRGEQGGGGGGGRERERDRDRDRDREREIIKMWGKHIGGFGDSI